LTRLVLINGLKYNYQLKPTQDKYAVFNNSIGVLGKCFYKFKSEEIIYNYTFIPVFHPTKNDFWDNGFPTNSLYYWYINNISTSAINLYEFFVKNESINTKNLLNYYWLLDGHNNAKGYAAFTRGVEWKLKGMGIAK